jgi:hypothetical protein
MTIKKVFAVIACVTACGTALFAQIGTGFDIRADGSGVVITKYTGPGGDVTIPAVIDGKAVVGIGEEVFRNNLDIESITLPEGLATIGANAFNGCKNLASVTIPASVTVIGEAAFFWCSGFVSITLPAGVTSIGNYAFGYCSGLVSIVIPASITAIGAGAFFACYNLRPEIRADIEMRFGQAPFRRSF